MKAVEIINNAIEYTGRYDLLDNKHYTPQRVLSQVIAFIEAKTVYLPNTRLELRFEDKGTKILKNVRRYDIFKGSSKCVRARGTTLEIYGNAGDVVVLDAELMHQEDHECENYTHWLFEPKYLNLILNTFSYITETQLRNNSGANAVLSVIYDGIEMLNRDLVDLKNSQ